MDSVWVSEPPIERVNETLDPLKNALRRSLSCLITSSELHGTRVSTGRVSHTS